MSVEATPRISARYLEQFQGQTIRMVCKVTNLRGEQATVDASGSVTVNLNRVCHCAKNFHYFCIIMIAEGANIRLRTPTSK